MPALYVNVLGPLASAEFVLLVVNVYSTQTLVWGFLEDLL